MQEGITSQELTNRLLMEIPRRFPGARVWRQNVGKAVGYEFVARALGLLARGAVKEAIEVLKRLRPILFGLRGQGDINGVLPIHIGARVLGLRLECEVKAGRDKMSEDQEAFRAMILKAGGIHVIARDVDAALDDIEAQLDDATRQLNA